MLVGGVLLLGASAVTEDWGEAVWGAKAIGSIVYLAVVGSAIAFVVLTILLREMSAQASSFIALMIPFGALVFGAVLYDEAITGRAVAGAALVVAGLLAASGGSSGARRRLGASRREPETPERVAV
jgi:drug/metabolite transporter (DMT)-like permease